MRSLMTVLILLQPDVMVCVELPNGDLCVIILRLHLTGA